MNIKQWFKSKPYWSKGAIIGGIIGVSLFLLLLVFSSVTGKTSDMGDVFIWIIILASLPIILLMDKLPGSLTKDILFYILEIFYFFIVGAIIGSLIAWIKRKLDKIQTKYSDLHKI